MIVARLDRPYLRGVALGLSALLALFFFAHFGVTLVICFAYVTAIIVAYGLTLGFTLPAIDPKMGFGSLLWKAAKNAFFMALGLESVVLPAAYVMPEAWQKKMVGLPSLTGTYGFGRVALTTMSAVILGLIIQAQIRKRFRKPAGS